MTTVHAPRTPDRVRDVLSEVESRISRLLGAEAERWGRVERRARTPVDIIADLVGAGGKRIRPMFCATGFLAAGGDPAAAPVVDAAAALELLHACALLHDDVMDRADRRRGRPTAHRRWARTHAELGWSGDPERFGESVAVLAGDLAFAYSDNLMARVPEPVRRIWDELRIELIVGQHLDVAASAERLLDVDVSSRIALYKSARYSVMRPLQIGVALAGRAADPEPLLRFGDAVGQAFQLRDDVLDLLGEPASAPGSDLAARKPTLLLARAFEGDAEVRRIVAEDDPADAAGLRRRIDELDAVPEVEAEIARLVAVATAAVAELDVPPHWRDWLDQLAHQAAYRDA